jgi:cytochrome bd-type quinol oxidase subunit 1
MDDTQNTYKNSEEYEEVIELLEPLETEKPMQKTSITAIILGGIGIIANVNYALWYWGTPILLFFGMFMSVLGFTTSIYALKRKPDEKKLALKGLIVSILGALSPVLTVAIFAFFASLGDPEITDIID